MTMIITSILLLLIYRLEHENAELKDLIEAKYVEQLRNEQLIRTTLVDQKEVEVREIETVWRNRYDALKKQVSSLM